MGCDEWGVVSADAGGAFFNCVQCVVFSRWDEGCVGVLGQDGEAVGCDEWGVSADAGGAFFSFVECVVFSGWDEDCNNFWRHQNMGRPSPQRTESDDALPSPSQSETIYLR